MKVLGYFALVIFLVIIAADFTSKQMVYQHLPLMSHQPAVYPYGGIPVFKNFMGIEFSIVHATNHGAAWGTFANWQLELVFLRILLIIGLIIYVLFFNKRPIWIIPLTLIIAGATGNVLDYFVYGHVIDMLHFVLWGYDYPVFNIADSMIFVGIVGILLSGSSKRYAQI